MVKNLPSNAGDTGLIPGWGIKIPLATGQQSPGTATTEPALWSPCTTTREPECHNHCTRTPQPRGPDAAKEIIKLIFFKKGKIRSQLEGAGWDQCSQILIPGGGQRRHVQDQSQVGRGTGSTGNFQHCIHTVDKQSILHSTEWVSCPCRISTSHQQFVLRHTASQQKYHSSRC